MKPLTTLLTACLLLTPLALPAGEVDEAFLALSGTEYAWRTGEGPGPKDLPLPDNARLDTVDAASQAQRLAYWQRVMKKLETLDVDQLSAANQVNYAVYKRQIENLIAEQHFKQWQMPFNSDSSFWAGVHYGLRGGGLKTADDYRSYIARLQQIPRYFDQQIANMRAGLARGFSVPRAVLDGRDQAIAAVAEATDPRATRFFEPLKDLGDRLPQAEAAKLQADADKAIREGVIPAYRKLLAFFRTEYVPKARKTLAAEAMPDGKAWYKQQIRQYTTLDLEPAAIHRIGLEQVAKIKQQMLEVIEQTGFKGSFAEFVAHLRSDPKFYAKTPQELLNKSAWVAKQVDGRIGELIGHLPRQRFTIVPVPAAIAPYYTSGRGGADEYLVNTWDLKSRALYNMPALTLHESYPGHSLQMQLARERSAQPAFRRDGYISAYGEGWGLYSEYLGNEMGIYDNPYKKFGYLTYQMWRACRLVIDTGVHHLGWSRDKAIAYLSDNTALSKLEIVNEVDRYISWPGQALSYELGYLTIRRLRAKAEQALGDKFDIRAFHDTVLSTGSVPLPVLEARIDRFIAEGGPEPDYGCACTKPAAAN